MLNENLVTDIYMLKVEKEKLEEESKTIKDKINEITDKISNLSNKLLEELNTNNLSEFRKDNLVASKQSQESITYIDENKIVNTLKTNFEGNYIKVSIKENLDKNALKKAMKSDNSLNEALSDLIKKTRTEYVVVTTEENHEKMLEHINKNK